MPTDVPLPPSPEDSAETPKSPPWWKKAPKAAPPKWASPAAVRRKLLQKTVLPARFTARGAAETPAEPANGDPDRTA